MLPFDQIVPLEKRFLRWGERACLKHRTFQANFNLSLVTLAQFLEKHSKSPFFGTIQTNVYTFTVTNVDIYNEQVLMCCMHA